MTQPLSAATVFDPRPCDLGEGPIWHPDRQHLFWFDIVNCRLLGQGTEGTQEWTLPEMVSAAGIVDRKRLLIASETGLWVFDLDSGDRKHLTDLDAANPHTRSNDGRADPQGGFWIGTMGKAAEPGLGAIWRWYQGELRCLFPGITIPNAICFAPDGRTGYFTDTPTRQIRRVALDADGWPAGESEVWIDLSGSDLNPDGAVTDAAGNLWVALWGAGRVDCHAPDGRRVRSVAIGAPHASCPAFGGPMMDRLYVTTARQGLDAAALARAPLSGQVFCALPVVTGRAEPRVRLAPR